MFMKQAVNFDVSQVSLFTLSVNVKFISTWLGLQAWGQVGRSSYLAAERSKLLKPVRPSAPTQATTRFLKLVV